MVEDRCMIAYQVRGGAGFLAGEVRGGAGGDGEGPAEGGDPGVGAVLHGTDLQHIVIILVT